MILARPKNHPLPTDSGTIKHIHLAALSALLILFALWLFSGAGEFAAAQDIFGRIVGSITDPSGAAVPNIKVTIINEATQVPRNVTADKNGYYVADELPVGTYAVTVAQQGFKTTTKIGNVLVAGGHLTVDLRLEVGAVTERVEVVAQSVAVNTVSGEISRTVVGKEVQNAALNERNYIQLVTLVPGAALTSFDQTTFTTGQGIAPANINGQRTDSNLVTVDGGYNLDSGSNGTQLNNVGIDFIHEVNIQTSNYSAEYGRSGGASVNVVTKSGGNSFTADCLSSSATTTSILRPRLPRSRNFVSTTLVAKLAGPSLSASCSFSSESRPSGWSCRETAPRRL